MVLQIQQMYRDAADAFRRLQSFCVYGGAVTSLFPHIYGHCVTTPCCVVKVMCGFNFYVTTLCLKKVSTFEFSVTLSNLNRFSKFLHCWKAYEIFYKTHTTLPTSL